MFQTLTGASHCLAKGSRQRRLQNDVCGKDRERGKVIRREEEGRKKEKGSERGPEKVRRRGKGEWGREKRVEGRLGGCRTGALSIFSVSPGPAVGLSCYGREDAGH